MELNKHTLLDLRSAGLEGLPRVSKKDEAYLEEEAALKAKQNGDSDIPPKGTLRGARTTLDAVKNSSNPTTGLNNFAGFAQLGGVGSTQLHDEEFELGAGFALIHCRPINEEEGAPKAVKVWFFLRDSDDESVRAEYVACHSSGEYPTQNMDRREADPFAWLTAAYPYPDPAKGNVYYDPKDAAAGSASSCWRKSAAGQNPTSDDEICREVQEHRACVLDPDTICAENAERRTVDESLPELRFYAIVQHEGEVIIHKRHNPHIVISIGQSFGVSRSFLEPQYAMGLMDNDEGVRKCDCPNGHESDKHPEWDLELRDIAPDPDAGVRGHPEH